MRQVPSNSYLIIGNGRVANHMIQYLEFENIPYRQWTKKLSEEKLKEWSQIDSPILLLISDSVIEDFITQRKYLEKRVLIHFSGALCTPLAYSTHPLMTFSCQTYDHKTYMKIPFIVEKKDKDFSDLLPGLSNPHFYLKSEQKSLYHALCVLSGNFSSILWNKAFAEIENMGLPQEVFFPYLDQITLNLKSKGASCLTGPLTRNDHLTIKKNLDSLKNDPYQGIYEAFVKTHEMLKEHYEHSTV